MTSTSTLRRGAVAAAALIALASAGIASASSEPPGGTEPPATEPAGSEPTGTDPAGTDPMGSEPTGTDPMGSEPTGSEPAGSGPAGSEPAGSEPAGGEPADTSGPTGDAPSGSESAGPTGAACAAVPTEGEGSVSGMADDPVATAASNNPLLSTLVTAVDAAGLVDTLNGEGPFTVFAPINTAFDKIPPATFEGVLADPTSLTSILTYHVLGERLSSADLVEGGTFTTVNGAELTVQLVGETLVINGGAAAVLCADVPTANATVYLIDTVLMPPAVAPESSAAPIDTAVATTTPG